MSTSGTALSAGPAAGTAAGTTGDPATDRASLLGLLAAQRQVVLDVVDGLAEDDWHRTVVPSGWTPAGLVAHLGDAERHWLQGVVAGRYARLSWDEDRPPYDPDAAFVCPRTPAEVIAFYRDQCARSDEILARTPLAAAPAARHGDPAMPEPADVRAVVLHLVEETARHAGHLDVARELLDGRTGLGPR